MVTATKYREWVQSEKPTHEARRTVLHNGTHLIDEYYFHKERFEIICDRYCVAPEIVSKSNKREHIEIKSEYIAGTKIYHNKSLVMGALGLSLALIYNYIKNLKIEHENNYRTP